MSLRSVASMLTALCCALLTCDTAGGLKNLKTGISRHIRSLAFPDGSARGIFFAIGIPIDIPDKSISLSFYFEANYQMPQINNSGQINASSQYFVRKRSLDRQILYHSIQRHLDGYGYQGRACLQRTICESARFPFGHSGLVGDLLRIIFTPSSSIDENLEADIQRAEYTDDCLKYQQDCPISLLDLITHTHRDDSQMPDSP